MGNAVTQWFGDAFSLLHPLLQQLHREGGTLTGRVQVEYGPGIAGWIGRRIAAKTGAPQTTGMVGFCVEIRHTGDALVWSRTFESGAQMRSLFRPHGAFPDGYWSESTGGVELHLGVDIREGGWRWVPQRCKVRGIPLPLWLVPRTDAYKTVVGDQYRFAVTLSLPVLGKLMSYSGDLRLGGM